MPRLIDAVALEVDLKRQYDEVFGKARKTVNLDDFFIERYSAYYANVVEAEQNGFFEYLKARPTVDAVPVVRCKECKHYRNHPNGMCYAWTEEAANARGYKGSAHCVEPSDFCSYGEREVQENETRCGKGRRGNAAGADAGRNERDGAGRKGRGGGGNRT